MSKTEYAWVIQRDDDRFFIRFELPNFYMFSNKLCVAETFSNKEVTLNFIERYKLQNCRPVKVKIEIVGEDDE